MTPSSQELGPPANPVRFKADGQRLQIGPLLAEDIARLDEAFLDQAADLQIDFFRRRFRHILLTQNCVFVQPTVSFALFF